MENIKELRQLRTVIRSCTTKLINKFDELEDRYDDKRFLSDFHALRVQLELKQQKLVEIDEKIFALLAADIDIDDATANDELPSCIADEVDCSEAKQLAATTCLSKLSFVIGVLEGSDRPNDASSMGSGVSELQEAIKELKVTTPRTPKVVRLPEIKLPRFNGDPMNFKSFWESFNATVHNQDDLEPCVKLTHLLSLLDGEAKATFEGTIPTNEMYEDVRERLKEKFGREQLVTLTYLRSLIHMPKSSDSATKLKGMLNSFQTHVRYLSKLEIDDWQDLIFIALLLDKIPADVEANIMRQQGNADYDYKTLCNMIEIETRAR